MSAIYNSFCGAVSKVVNYIFPAREGEIPPEELSEAEGQCLKEVFPRIHEKMFPVDKPNCPTTVEGILNLLGNPDNKWRKEYIRDIELPYQEGKASLREVPQIILRDFPVLNGLNLEGHPIQKFPEALPAYLNFLNLNGHELQDFSFLKDASNLTTLLLSGRVSKEERKEGEEDAEGVISPEPLDFSCFDEKSVYYLVYLNLAHCGIEKLPENFSKMFPHLRWLNLRDNQIEDINPLVGCMKLEQLYLSGNKIQHVPEGILNLPNLKNICFADNPISDREDILRRLRQKVKERNEILCLDGVIKV